MHGREKEKKSGWKRGKTGAAGTELTTVWRERKENGMKMEKKG